MQLKELFEKIDALKAEIDRLRPLKPEVEQRIMQKFRLDWNYHSNAIEGNSLTRGETHAFLMEGLTADGKPLKDHLDIRGHDNLINFLVLFIQRKEDLTEAAIREMHKILLHEPYETEAVTLDGRIVQKLVRLGEYKLTPNFVRTGAGDLRPYAMPEDVPPKMHELIEWHRKQTKLAEIHPVAHAALFHHQFLAIHPFDDGNGRLGRILMNLILMRHGFPPVVIKLPARERYVAALRKADAGEPADTVSFVGGCLLDSETLYLRGAHGESIEDSDDIEKEWALLKNQLRDVPKPVELSEEVQLAFLRQKLSPLLQRIDEKVSQFDEAFTESYLEIQYSLLNAPGFVVKCKRAEAGDQLVRLLASGVKSDLMKGLFEGTPVGGGLFHEIELRFRWQEFQRAGTNDFSVYIPFQFRFEKNKFHICCEVGKLNQTLLYQQWLSEDQVNDVVSGIAKTVLAQIQAGLARNRPR